MAASIFVDPYITLSHKKGSLMGGAAETSYTVGVAGRAPDGVMLLGTTQSIPVKVAKVKYFSTKAKAQRLKKYYSTFEKLICSPL